MADTLFLRIRDEVHQWLVFDASGRMVSEATGTADEFRSATEALSEAKVIFVVPGEDVLLTKATIPSRQHRQIVQAVPYAIEEQLAMDVEDCLFALGLRNINDDIQVAVIERRLVAAHLDKSTGLGLQVGTMVSETSLLPASAGISILIDGHRAHIRWPDATGMTVHCADLPLTLSIGPAELPIDITGSQTDIDACRIQLNELEAIGETLDIRPVDHSGFHLLCAGYSGQETNLLQGEFKVEEAVSSIQLVWRSVAILAGIAFTLHIATLVGEGWYLDARATQYKNEANALYAEVFPKDRNVRDLRRRWNAHLGRTETEGNEFISLFSQASRGLPGAGLTLSNVNFNESRGDLILQVAGKRSEELVQYTQQLKSEGLDAEIGTINQDAGTVRGSIKVRSRGAG